MSHSVHDRGQLLPGLLRDRRLGVTGAVAVAGWLLASNLGLAYVEQPLMPVASRSQIAFDGGSGRGDVFGINEDGSGLRPLTRNPATDYGPVWSPDGRKVAFGTYRDGNHEIYVMNPDGSQQRNLTRNPAFWDVDPVWAPNGRTIAFDRAADASPDDSDWSIFLMSADGRGQRKLTQGFGSAWSPDGRRIAFERFVTGRRVVYLMNADGSRPTRLTEGFDPVWSLDGRTIAFTRAEDQQMIHVIRADGSGERRVTRPTSRSYEEVVFDWSPDGRRFVFGLKSGVKHATESIYVVNVDGSGQRKLADGDRPHWSPDGRKIAFVRWRGPSPLSWSLLMMNRDGTHQRRLFASREEIESIAWRPSGR
jgi:TolB protein